MNNELKISIKDGQEYSPTPTLPPQRGREYLLFFFPINKFQFLLFVLMGLISKFYEK